MKREFVILLIGIFLISGVLAVGEFGTATDGNIIYKCGTINTSGVYTLNQSLTTVITCLNITSSDVTINGAGRNITGGDPDEFHTYYGIYAKNLNNLTVRDFANITYFTYGISLTSVSNSSFENFSSSENRELGVLVSASTNNSFSNIVTTRNSNGLGLYSASTGNLLSEVISSYNGGPLSGGYGVIISSSNNNTLSNISSNFNVRYGLYLVVSNNTNLSIINCSYNTRYGLYFISSNNNTLLNFTCEYNTQYGILMTSSSDNLFSEGNINSNYQGVSISSGSGNLFNNSKLEKNFLGSAISNGSIFELPLQRTYLSNQQITLVFNNSINGVFSSGYNSSVSIYPSNDFQVVEGTSNLTVVFTPVREGVHTASITLTDSRGNQEIVKFIFLVGALSSGTARYYMHSDDPKHGQPLGWAGYDSGSMFFYPTTLEEERHCQSWVQYQPDELRNFYPIVKNVSMGFFYNGSGTISGGVEQYVTYSLTTNSSVLMSSSASYIFAIVNITGLNITSDYTRRLNGISLKLQAIDVSVKSNATQQSYADFEYIYAGPRIEQFSGYNVSDISNIELLSSVFNDGSGKNISLEFEGEGEFVLVVNLTNASYGVVYDGRECSENENCTINSNDGQIINLTLNGGEYNLLTIEEDLGAPLITLVSPVDLSSTVSNSIVFQFDVTDLLSDIDSCSLFIDNVEHISSDISETNGNNISVSSISVGSHSWYINCNDTLGNEGNSSLRNFTITSVAEEEESSSGGGSANTVTSVSDSMLENGISRVLTAGSGLKFNLNSESHNLKLNSILNGKINFTISSEPQSFVLSAGESVKVDVDSDDKYDIVVSYLKNYGNRVELKIEKCEDCGSVPADFKEEFEEEGSHLNVLEGRKSSFFGSTLWVIIGIVLTLIVLVLAVRSITSRKRYSKNINWKKRK